MGVQSSGPPLIYADQTGVGIGTTNPRTALQVDGTITAQSKRFRQAINDTHDAVYTSQESPMPRAVITGSLQVNQSTTIDLPEHFTAVTSDEKPQIRAQVTPHSLALVAVTERSTSQITVTSDEAVTVDYRVSAVRDGYEDKDVVQRRNKE